MVKLKKNKDPLDFGIGVYKCFCMIENLLLKMEKEARNEAKDIRTNGIHVGVQSCLDAVVDLRRGGGLEDD